jgi:hypothetical protein
MRKVAVYRNGIFAGILIEENRKQFVFKYDKIISMTPKCQL